MLSYHALVSWRGKFNKNKKDKREKWLFKENTLKQDNENNYNVNILGAKSLMMQL